MKRLPALWCLLLVSGLLPLGCRSEESSDMNSFIHRMIGGGDSRRYAAMISDPNDPDRRRRGIQHCSTRSWGHSDRFCKVYAMVLEKDSDPTVRAEAAAALGRTKKPQYQPNLIVALAQDPSPAVRWAAAVSLDELPGPDAQPVLQKKARSDPSIDVRASSARALRHYRNHQAVAALVDCLNDDEFTVRHEARAALIEMTGLERGYEPEDWADVAAGRSIPSPDGSRPWWDWMGVTGDKGS